MGWGWGESGEVTGAPGNMSLSLWMPSPGLGLPSIGQKEGRGSWGLSKGTPCRPRVSVVLRCLLAMGEVEAGLGGGRSQTESALAPSEGLLASGLASPGQSSAPGGLNEPDLS